MAAVLTVEGRTVAVLEAEGRTEVVAVAVLAVVVEAMVLVDDDLPLLSKEQGM